MTAQQHSTYSSCEIIIVLIYDPPLRKGKDESVYHFIKIYFLFVIFSYIHFCLYFIFIILVNSVSF